MREIYDGPHNRKILYGAGGALAVLLLAAGLVYKPEPPPPTVSDLRVDLTLHMNCGLEEDARRDIEAILARDPRDLYARLSQAYLYARSGDRNRAIEAYRACLALPGMDPGLAESVLDDCARLALQEGRFEDARAFVEERIARFGSDFRSKIIYALSCLLVGDDKRFAENMVSAVEEGGGEAVRDLVPAALLEDREALDRVFLQGLIARERVERKLLGMAWM